MTVSYQIDAEDSLIRTRCTGDVTFEEVIGHFRELEKEPSLPERLHVLLDLSEMESVPASAQMGSVAGEIGDLRTSITWGSVAIVAKRDVLFGMSRVFHAFAEAHFAESNVFRDVDEAERWLAREH